jgi:hypothetical protein
VIAATVVIPTHAHVAPLRLAVRSVQAQSVQDFELFIVGDGVGDATRALVAELAAQDDRIRFFDFQKGPRKGECHRHTALQEARGRIVAYLGDDDCWMPNHLAVLDDLLSDADFGHTLQLGVDEHGEIVALPAALEDPDFRRRMLNEPFNRFDLTFGGHTLDAYRRLPHGWRTTPAEFPWTDLYMWRQLLEQPWCRARSAMIPTGINTWTHRRPELTDEQRAEDLALWHARIADAGYREQLCTDIIGRFAGESVRFEMQALQCARRCDALEAQLADAREVDARARDVEARAREVETRAREEHARARERIDEFATDVERLEREVGRLGAKVELHARAALAMSTSKSWRWTAPLRKLRSRVRRRKPHPDR